MHIEKESSCCYSLLLHEFVNKTVSKTVRRMLKTSSKLLYLASSSKGDLLVCSQRIIHGSPTRNVYVVHVVSLWSFTYFSWPLPLHLPLFPISLDPPFYWISFLACCGGCYWMWNNYDDVKLQMLVTGGMLEGWLKIEGEIGNTILLQCWQTVILKEWLLQSCSGSHYLCRRLGS